MKKLIRLSCILFFILLATYSKAQYVTIHDPNFRNWLQINYSGCMNESQLDTTCYEVLNAVMVNVSSQNISDVNGIRYFKSLQYFHCAYNQLTSLAALPSSLIYLECSSNQLTSLPVLPLPIGQLYCSSNRLTSLPVLPNQLWNLGCSQNLLTSLPDLPASLQYLFCHYNQLTSLPVLPTAYFGNLGCDYNQLTALPALPNSLRVFSCNHNQLTNMPVLPVHLYALSCTNNQLTSLPELPEGMNNLDCSVNSLVELNNLPASLSRLTCRTNQLTCLPLLPDNLQQLEASGNSIICLPNVPAHSSFTSDIGTVVCDYGANNPHGCPVTLATAISDAVAQSDIVLYPNPSHGALHVLNNGNSTHTATLKMIDSKGSIVYQASHLNLSVAQKIDLSNLTRGIYMLQVIQEEKLTMHRIVLE